MTKFSHAIGIIVLLLLLAACGGASIGPGLKVEPISSPTAALTPTLTMSLNSATPVPGVPRNQTLVLGSLLQGGIGITNPLAGGYTHAEGNNLLWEGLSYYAIFSKKEIPWLAESMEYTKPAFTELTIHLNKQARWSDGVPLTAKDVVYTFQEQFQNETVPYHSQFNQFVQDFHAVDDWTVVLRFKIPAPRFKFEALTLKFDIGISIVPEHILSAQADVNAFAGAANMPHSGPYQIVDWTADQKVYDLRPDWWAIQAGLVAMPAVKRVVIRQIPFDVNALALHIANGEYDAALPLSAPVISNILKENPNITSYSGNEPPYGNLDWWPNSLWVNTQLAPYDDVRERRALSLAIDRDGLNELLFEGAPVATIYPFPLYPALEEFVNCPEVKTLEAKYAPGKFDLNESARLMTEAGYHKNADGLWEKDGKTFDATIDGVPAVHSDTGPVLVEMLKRGGFDSSMYFGADSVQRMTQGKPGLYLFGHGASLIDPYAALELYHSRHSKPTGEESGFYLSRYKNPEYDAILDRMAELEAQDPEFQQLATQALEIYWRDVIDIPVFQWLHRIPYNQTYWTNWPTQNNLALGTIGAPWSHTGMLVITSLQPAH